MTKMIVYILGFRYIHEHAPLLSDAVADQKETFRNKWLDRYTRAVIAEFVLYNAHANLFSCVTILMEMSSTGGKQLLLLIPSDKELCINTGVGYYMYIYL